MHRARIQYIVDGIILLDLLGVAFIGLLLGFVIPRGGGPHEGKYLWGLHRHQWGNLHLTFSLAFLALLVIHIALHWHWIVCMTRGMFKKQSQGST